MPGVVRVGRDSAGGGIVIGPGNPTVLVNGAPISTVSDVILTHGPAPHIQPLIATGSKTVFAGGRPISLALSSVVTCGDTLLPGSTNVIAG